MKKAAFAVILLFGLCPSLPSQTQISKIKVRVILVDKDLNQKPVPHLTLVLSAVTTDPDHAQEAKTDFNGNAEFQAAPGKYLLSTPQGVDFAGHHYDWDVEVNVGAETVSMDMSNDNSRVSDLPAAEPKHQVDDLTQMFQKCQKSVVTVWSEIGSGTGFIVDSSGLIMTNQHVIGPSELISVQFDAKRKVAAKVLAFDAERDVAILYADLSAFPGALVAPIARKQAGHEIAVEGERVFTIGSPLGLKKIITTAIVSKVEDRAIISDVNIINHGNSGGRLFNSLGEVIGITTFSVDGKGGAGLTGIVRIDQTTPTLERAHKKMQDISMPSARLLPVEPSDPYPLDSFKDAIRSAKLDQKPYFFSVGGFDVELRTPVLDYEIKEEAGLAAAREKDKRTKQGKDSIQNTFDPLEDLRDWNEYVGAHKPILFVEAFPQLRETFLSGLGRELIPAVVAYTGGERKKFRSDFYRMKLICGTKEVEPIQPGKAATVVNEHNSFLNVDDATYVGIYSYPADAISPACGKVTLQIFSEKDPQKPESKELEEKSVNRVWNDFKPYLAAHINSGRAQ